MFGDPLLYFTLQNLILLRTETHRDFLEILWLKLQASTAGARVQSLAWELRSHVLLGVTKKEEVRLTGV